MSTTVDLWPKKIEVKRVTAPVTIMREQASILGRKTKNLVQAEVEGGVSPHDRSYFSYRFFLVAPALGNYRYRLFTVDHGIDFYPLDIYVEESILEELRQKFDVEEYHEYGHEAEHVVVKSEDRFLEALRIIFGAPKTVGVISSLLSQSESLDLRIDLGLEVEVQEEDIPF